MLERMMTDPNAGGGDPNAGGGDPNAGGGDQSPSTQQIMDSLAKVMGAEAPGINENDEFRLRQEARNMIEDTQKSVRNELPDITESQINLFTEGMINQDPVQIINAVRDALKVMEESQANEKKQQAGSLNVQGTGNGKGGGQNAPRSLQEAALQASRLFDS